MTYYWSAVAPHTSLVWQDEDTWIQKFHSLLLDSLIEYARSILATRQTAFDCP